MFLLQSQIHWNKNPLRAEKCCSFQLHLSPAGSHQIRSFICNLCWFVSQRDVTLDWNQLLKTRAESLQRARWSLSVLPTLLFLKTDSHSVECRLPLSSSGWSTPTKRKSSGFNSLHSALSRYRRSAAASVTQTSNIHWFSHYFQNERCEVSLQLPLWKQIHSFYQWKWKVLHRWSFSVIVNHVAILKSVKWITTWFIWTYFVLKGSRRVCSWKQDINKMQQRDDEDYFNQI